ncbi:MAG: type II secretion system F family protein [Sphingomonadales bacterium]
MKRYEYSAANPAGDVDNDIVKAQSKSDAARLLLARGKTPLRITEVREGLLARLNREVDWGGKPNARQLTFLTQQLSALLDANLDLEQALDVLADQIDEKAPKRFIERLLGHVREGQSLASALEQEKKTPEFYNGIVRAAQEGGNLAPAFSDLADYLERADEVRLKMVSALIYPAVVLMTVFVAILIILLAVIPEFEPVFQGQEDQLPGLTQVVLALSRSLNNHGVLIFCGLLMCVIASAASFKTSQARQLLDGFVLSRAPFSALTYQTIIAPILRVLGSMLRSGVPLATAVELASTATQNMAVRAQLHEAAQAVREGRSLHSILSTFAGFPKTALHLLRVGEETAQLDVLAIKASAILTFNTRTKIDRLMALLNPLATIVLGIIVAALVGAVMLGILSVNDLAR